MLREKLSQAQPQWFTLKFILIALSIVGAMVLLGGGGTSYAISQRPELGAQIADVLRSVLGDQAVASIETFVFQVQDNVRKLEYQVTGKKPASPWSLTPIPTQIVQVTPTLAEATSSPSSPQSQPTASQPQPAQTVKPRPTLNLVGVTWPPPNITNRMGMLEDEGIWVPYIYDSSGRVAAYRTFLQPDRERPYVVTAIVVFNLSVTRIGYVPGTIEPASTARMYRPGTIPIEDKQPGVLLAAFNGGFQTRHGNFGVMHDTFVLVPPRNDIATLALYHDGRITITPWDAKLYDNREVRTWRQNGAILIYNNEINPESTDKNKLLDNWGGNVTHVVGEEVVTWRSGVGLSANKQFLYYVAGPSLTVYTLANVFKTVGAKDAMQLDINPYWVQFISVNTVNNQLKANPLLAEMSGYTERYLGAYTGDYFYVVSHNPEP
jgi:hypothetical protein